MWYGKISSLILDHLEPKAIISYNCGFWFLQTIICRWIPTSYPSVRTGGTGKLLFTLTPSFYHVLCVWVRDRQVDLHKCLCLKLSLKARFDCIGLYYDFRVIIISNELPILCRKSESYVHSPLQIKNQNKSICST